MRRIGQRGYILVGISVSAIALAAMLGVSVDIGRMFIAKSEAQAFADSASIAAALKLDGTQVGITNATAAFNANANKWDFSSKAFTDKSIAFAASPAGPWSATPASAASVRYARVTASAPVKLLFLPVVVRNAQQTNVTARATAAQAPKTSFREALFPFSPFMHSGTPPDFGLVPGTLYTLRWPSNPTLGGGQSGNSNVCAGDQLQSTIDLANAQGGSERGFIEDTSASLIRSTIVDDFQSVTRTVGDVVSMTGGAKQSQLTSLNTRIQQDTDASSTTYSQYIAKGQGNGRRIVACPINDGGTPPGTDNRIVGIGAFFLQRTGDYGNGGSQCWCAEYVGTWVQGTTNRGAGDGTNTAFVVRLVE